MVFWYAGIHRLLEAVKYICLRNQYTNEAIEMVKMTVEIDDDLNERLWKHIRKKFPSSTYGAVKAVVTEALDEYLTKRGVK